MRIPFVTRAFVVAVVSTLAVSACAPRVANRGNMPDADRITQIKPGETDKGDVERLLGSPSSIAPFGDEKWMYIGEITETMAFFQPKVAERHVLVITFDDKGTVKDLEAHGMEASNEIEPVKRITPTVGKELTVLEQIVGNLNRYRGDRGKKK